MKKKLYYQLSDGEDVKNVVMNISGCMRWIIEDAKEAGEQFDRVYIIKPVWLTDKEYKNIPEL